MPLGAALLIGIAISAQDPAFGSAEDYGIVIVGIDDGRDTTRVSQLDTTLAVNAGVVDAKARRTPRSGRMVRWDNDGGAFVVWTFAATAHHNAHSARFEIQATPAQQGELRFARGRNNRWNQPQAGQKVPLSQPLVVHAALMNGETVVFQLAVPIRDNMRAGYYRPTIQYWMHPNGAPKLRHAPLPNLVGFPKWPNLTLPGTRPTFLPFVAERYTNNKL